MINLKRRVCLRNGDAVNHVHHDIAIRHPYKIRGLAWIDGKWDRATWTTEGDFALGCGDELHPFDLVEE